MNTNQISLLSSCNKLPPLNTCHTNCDISFAVCARIAGNKVKFPVKFKIIRIRNLQPKLVRNFLHKRGFNFPGTSKNERGQPRNGKCSGASANSHKNHLKNIIIKVLLRLFILYTEKHCEHFNYAFMSENT